jgi:hypothetical protein
MTTDNFKKWLAEGKEVEIMALGIIKKKYPCSIIIEGNFKYYDIWIPELHKSVEIKSCPRCHEFGKIVIEIENYYQPTALLVSKADYWVIYDGTKFRIMTKNDILHCIFMNKLVYEEIYGEGDDVPKKAFKVPVDKLLSYGKDLI